MHAAGGSEEYVSWPKRLSPFAADKFAGTRGDKVNLIPRMWLLWIDPARGIDFNQQTAMLENSCEALAFRSG